MNLNFSFFTGQVITNFILKGLSFSFKLTLMAMLGGIFLGLILAIMRESKQKWLQIPANIYVNTFRSIPLVMVILWFYLLIPLIIKHSIGAELSALISFTIFEAAYFSEIIRAGMHSVSSGQINTGMALGFTKFQCLQYIILPQAFRNMLPVMMTQTIILFQDTSLVYAIGAYDLLKGFEIAGKNYNRPLETYLIAAGTYFIICFVFSKITRHLQKNIQIIR